MACFSISFRRTLRPGRRAVRIGVEHGDLARDEYFVYFILHIDVAQSFNGLLLCLPLQQVSLK